MELIIIAAIVTVGVLILFAITGALLAALAALAIVLWFIATLLGPGDIPPRDSGGQRSS